MSDEDVDVKDEKEEKTKPRRGASLQAYDDNENYCEGDPNPDDLTEEQWEKIGALQREIDAIEAIESDALRRVAARNLWSTVYARTHQHG